MSEFDEVLLRPHSIIARKALAENWRLGGDPRAQFIADQIDAYEGRFYPNDRLRVERAIMRAIAEHGREWAGALAEVFTDFRFELGLVYAAAMSVEVFVSRGMELVRRAPIIHVALAPPGNPTRVADVPALAQMRSLAFGGGPEINDEVVERLAASPYAAGLRAIDLSRGNITDARAIERLGSLPNLIFIDVTENPCAKSLASGRVQNVNEHVYIVGDAGRSSLREEVAVLNRGYDPGGRILWPPSKPEFSFDNDG